MKMLLSMLIKDITEKHGVVTEEVAMTENNAIFDWLGVVR
jgi:hypothetical protein